MHTFKDTLGREWSVGITVAGARRVKAAAGVDLWGLVSTGLTPLGELVADPCRLFEVLALLVEDQLAERKLTDEDLGKALAGESLASATDAFVQALLDFLPSREGREEIRSAIARGREMADRLSRERAARIAAFDVDAEVKRLLADAPTAPTTNHQGE